MTVNTLNNTMPPADICRANGWGVGLWIIGTDSVGTATIEITAIGMDSILARQVQHNGGSCFLSESLWCLSARDWRPFGPGQ